MFEVAATIFRPTSPTNQNRPILKNFNFCVLCPICMKVGASIFHENIQGQSIQDPQDNGLQKVHCTQQDHTGHYQELTKKT